jgi:hypothetical protein
MPGPAPTVSSTRAAVAPRAAAPPPPRRALARLAVAGTALVFVAAVALLFYRWVGAREPTSYVVIYGTPRWDGMTATVEGVGLSGGSVTVTLSADNDYRTAIFLDHGDYRIRISDGSRTIFERGFLLGRREGIQFDLATLEPLLDVATRPAAAGGSSARAAGANDADRRPTDR